MWIVLIDIIKASNQNIKISEYVIFLMFFSYFILFFNKLINDIY